MFRAATVGEVKPKLRKLYHATERALRAVVDAIRPGAVSEEVDKAGRDVIAEAGFGPWHRHRIGYSIGVNYPPDWGEGVFLDLKAGDETLLEPGMVFHIPQTLRLKGEAPVAISETVMVTERGRSVVTDYPRDLIVIE